MLFRGADGIDTYFSRNNRDDRRFRECTCGVREAVRFPREADNVRYNFDFMISTASAEVSTGTISKSAKSRQFAIHLSNSARSSVCISCQQVLKLKSIQLEMYSSPSGIIRPLCRKRR